MNYGTLILTFALAIIFQLVVNKDKKQRALRPKSFSEADAKKFVSDIEKLGYFKYADKSNIAKLKNNFLEDWDPTNELVTITDDETNVPLDYRYYMCDGEDLFEQGGFTEMLQELQPTFDKINFKCVVTNHVEEWDSVNNWLNHSITINGTDYIIFKEFKDVGWGEAAHKFASVLNAELAKQNIDERIYLASGGNDGRLVFLNEKLYKYIYSVYTNPNWKPLEAEEWLKVMRG